jgi:hypothetical protein
MLPRAAEGWATLRQDFVGSDDEGVAVEITPAVDSGSGKTLQDWIVKRVTALTAQQELAPVGKKINPGSFALTTDTEWFTDNASCELHSICFAGAGSS